MIRKPQTTWWTTALIIWIPFRQQQQRAVNPSEWEKAPREEFGAEKWLTKVWGKSVSNLNNCHTILLIELKTLIISTLLTRPTMTPQESYKVPPKRGLCQVDHLLKRTKLKRKSWSKSQVSRRYKGESSWITKKLRFSFYVRKLAFSNLKDSSQNPSRKVRTQLMNIIEWWKNINNKLKTR